MAIRAARLRALMRRSPPQWSWPEFLVGAVVGLLVAGLLWLAIKVVMTVLLLGVLAAVGFAVAGGLGKLRWLGRSS